MLTIEKILLEFDPEKTNLLPALKKISAAFGYISEKDAPKAAEYFSVPASQVYEVASFYDLINVKKPPAVLIQVCSSTHCAHSRSFQLIEEIENYFRIKSGDESNPKVRLEEISCLGRCAEGPVIIVNGKAYKDVNSSSVHEIIKNYI